MKKVRSIRGWLLVGIAAMMIFVTACGKSNEGTNNSAEGTAGNAGNAGGNKTVTLTLMHPWTSPNVDNDVYKARIEEFKKQFPNIIIKQDDVASDQYKTKLFTLAAGNSIADIVVTWPGADLNPLVAGNLLMPLNDYMDNWSALIPEDKLVGYNVAGNQYAIPTKQNFVDIIYYNKEMFANVGYKEFPTTYEAWIDAIKKLKATGVSPISLGNKEKWPLQSSYMSTIVQRFAGNDFLQNVVDGKAKFTDERFVKAVAVIDELTKIGAFNADANNMDSVQAQDYFIQGKAAMHITSATVNGRVRINNEEGGKFGIALFPSMPGGEGDPLVSAGVSQYGIAIKSELTEEKKAAALEFIKFFVNKDLYKELTKVGIMVPAAVEIDGEVNPYLKEMIALTSNGSTRVFDAVIPTSTAKEFENGIQGLTIGRGTPEEVAKATQEEFDRSNK
jgi:raffinose/stachyose/melibiose transport system substrate-binding protein